MTREPSVLGRYAKAGFVELSSAAVELDALAQSLGLCADLVVQAFPHAADPDAALAALRRIAERDPERLRALLADPDDAVRLVRLVGASRGFAELFARVPETLVVTHGDPEPPGSFEAARADLAESVAGFDVHDAQTHAVAVRALRVRYRMLLARLASWDLAQDDHTDGLPQVAATLADLAGATLDVALDIARRTISAPESPRPGEFPAAEVAATRLAIIGMGKAGARELNYVSDVDVIYVGDTADPARVPLARAIDIATRLAIVTARIITEPGLEPPLWDVDPNLRPEGKRGALVRSLESHVQYYERWAEGWEFQALLKARAMAGDADLGARYIERLSPMVWASSSREGFVEQVQRMRERVTAHIPATETDRHIKLGAGGLRDVEFTVQLLQLVHGATDAAVRAPATLDALRSLAASGYVGRAEAVAFDRDYRTLRVLEHRVQLAQLRRTHLFPATEAGFRVLARASGLARTAKELVELWQGLRQRVRGLHERLFYRPLLGAVAALPAAEFELGTEDAVARLAAAGYRDPKGALAHLRALTAGMSRRAAIQRHLLPVLLSWFAEGPDPDLGLLTFRTVSDSLGDTPWYLRMLRDSSDAARRLTRVLASSRYVSDLFRGTPTSVAWLEQDAELQPRALEPLQEEALAVLDRHDTEGAAHVLRGIRRRELLRLAVAAILNLTPMPTIAAALSSLAQSHLQALLAAIRGPEPDGIEFAIIGMGRFGGGELGFGSDVDILYVYRPTTAEPDAAHSRAQWIVSELVRLSEDPRLPFVLDADLRPEGRNGVVVRSVEAYRAYYERWSLTWEAQALLRARPVAGDAALQAAFLAVVDPVRYPSRFGEAERREVRRIKARMEKERLPKGADPKRHLKLGRGSLSDVEWFVQLIQLQHAAAVPTLRTCSTLAALDGAVAAGFVSASDATILTDAWQVASRARSALTLWLAKTTDVLPADRMQLEGVARLMGYPIGSASHLEEEYLLRTRQARAVFERGFYGA